MLFQSLKDATVSTECDVEEKLEEAMTMYTSCSCLPLALLEDPQNTNIAAIQFSSSRSRKKDILKFPDNYLINHIFHFHLITIHA